MYVVRAVCVSMVVMCSCYLCVKERKAKSRINLKGRERDIGISISMYIDRGSSGKVKFSFQNV